MKCYMYFYSKSIKKCSEMLILQVCHIIVSVEKAQYLPKTAKAVNFGYYNTTYYMISSMKLNMHFGQYSFGQEILKNW